VLYVGKASSLQDRVRSYWRPSAQLTPRQAALLREVRDLDYLVTASPVEALALECNLIKEHRPRYNVRLRDDKNYPYLRIPVGDPWPRVMVVRGVRDDGARYFGPYTRSQALQETLRLLRRHFPFRTCSEARFRQHRERPCLHYFVGRCAGPCAGLVSPERYASIIRGVISFLEGRQEELLDRLRREMEEAAERLEFERAAEIRDRLRSLEEVVERQRVVFPFPVDLDALAVAFRGREGVAQVFAVRGGRLVGREAFPLAVPEGAPEEEVISAFLQQFYARAAEIPPRVLVPYALEEKGELEEFLSRRRGGRVRVRVPRGGQEAALMRLALENAREFLQAEGKEESGLDELAALLGLPGPPGRIEGYDMSHLAGGQSVGVMVVFLEGRPAPSLYRRFRIRRAGERDDYAMMREVSHPAAGASGVAFAGASPGGRGIRPGLGGPGGPGGCACPGGGAGQGGKRRLASGARPERSPRPARPLPGPAPPAEGAGRGPPFRSGLSPPAEEQELLEFRSGGGARDRSSAEESSSLPLSVPGGDLPGQPRGAGLPPGDEPESGARASGPPAGRGVKDHPLFRQEVAV